MLTIRTVQPELQVLLGARSPVVSSQALARVEEIWEIDRARRGDVLFNNQLFSIETVESGRIVGWLGEYKWFLAQRRDQSLHKALRVCPLAVTGLLMCEDGIVFGKRAGRVEQDAGLWELVPSGGVDGSTQMPDGSIDIAQQVLAELKEEVGINAEMVAIPPQPFAIVQDSESHVSDVGFLLRTGLTKASVMGAFSSLSNREYVALEVIPTADVLEFVSNQSQALAEVSSTLLDAAIPFLTEA